MMDIEKAKIEEIRMHNKMANYYEESKNVIDFLSDFFTLRRGYRPIAIQKRFPKLKRPFAYYPNTKRLVHFDELDIKNGDLYKNVGQLHFFEFIFDEGIKDWHIIKNDIDENSHAIENFGLQEVFDKHIIGAGIVFDIDAPKDAVTKRKKNFFDVYEEYMQMKILCEETTEKYGFQHNAIFTGNGIDIVLESYYFDEIEKDSGNDSGESDKIKNLYEFKNEIDNLMLKINYQYLKKVGISDKKLIPHVDDRFKSWWSYNKCPFTYHNKWSRITIPLKEGYIDKEWLIKYSNFDYVIDNRLEDEIIKECKWRRLW